MTNEYISNSLRNLIARGELVMVNDAPKMQTLQASLLTNETLEGVERFQNYGMSSNPQVGAEPLMLFVGGDRSHPVCVALDDRRYRPTSLEAGEVIIYTDEGDTIHLKRGNTIEVTTKNLIANAENVTVNAENVTINSTNVSINASNIAMQADSITFDSPNATFTGQVGASGDMSAGSISMQSHVHSGVYSGDSNTGTPV